MRLSLSSSFIGMMMVLLNLASIAADECSSIEISSHINKKVVAPGSIVKLAFKVTNVGNQKVIGANLRLNVPLGADYQTSSVVPKMKPRIKPIDLQPNIYWTDFDLNSGKSRKFEIKVKEKEIEGRRIQGTRGLEDSVIPIFHFTSTCPLPDYVSFHYRPK